MQRTQQYAVLLERTQSSLTQSGLTQSGLARWRCGDKDKRTLLQI